MKLRFRGRTDVGKTRDHNEDDYGYGEGAQVEHYGELLVVCDGMGGHAAGEVASHLGVETIIAAYYGDPSDDRTEALRQAFEQANTRIHSEGRGSMGTTGVAALLHHDALHMANVGDSRGYLIRGGELRQVTRDHSLVSEQVAAGVITAEQARSLYYRNVITRALGYQPDVMVDIFRWPLQPGDVIVLCSDGLHGLVTDEEIGQIAASEPLDQAVEQLVDLANERGGSDNITLLIAHVDALEWAVDGADADADTQERATIELPPHALATSALRPDATQTTAPMSAGHTQALEPQRAAPRRLGIAGLLLSTALLLVLGAALFLLRPETVQAPASTPTALITPAATAEVAPAAATALPAATATRAASATPAATATRAASATPAATTTPRPTP